ncbi:hypothetical protein QFZ72_003058 [Bacillus sp. V2I10]|nr:hypothetical protein [Bacillus sp. V2I10]
MTMDCDFEPSNWIILSRKVITSILVISNKVEQVAFHTLHVVCKNKCAFLDQNVPYKLVI